MAGWLTVNTSELDYLVRWINELDDVVRRPQVMVPMVHAFGRGTNSAFKEDRTPWGRSWQYLSDMTNEKRRERGYPEKNPILNQSGQLRNAASGAFLSWKDTQSSSRRNFTAPYGNFDHLAMSATISNGRFHASISGPRVQNQYGGKLSGTSSGSIRRYIIQSGYSGRPRTGIIRRADRQRHLPARPFWSIEPYMIQGGMTPMMQVLMQQWGMTALGAGK